MKTEQDLGYSSLVRFFRPTRYRNKGLTVNDKTMELHIASKSEFDYLKDLDRGGLKYSSEELLSAIIEQL